jgi:N utilization substance protein A
MAARAHWFEDEDEAAPAAETSDEKEPDAKDGEAANAEASQCEPV